MSFIPKPVFLLILDGWGYREEQQYNAIASARTPVWDALWDSAPHTLIQASEAAVGLPASQMGNSEVGHLNIGAGRVVYQEYSRINRAIGSGAFFKNKALTDACDIAIEHDKAVHIMGLLSAGGVHSHEDHIHAMAELAITRGVKRVYLHASLDGRDTPPQSAGHSIRMMEEKFAALGGGQFASVIGRHYSMDRDHRWPRIQAAYDLMTMGKAAYETTSASEALNMAYAREETDEFVKATAITDHEGNRIGIEDGDVLIFMNFRSDRARQITRPFIEADFDAFERAHSPALGRFVSLTEYNSDFDIPVAFPPERLANVFGEILATLGKRQLRIAETEKYAHVTFFMNGGREAPFEGEDRILVNSPTDVRTYNQKPEMSADEVVDKAIKAIHGGDYDVIICNLANPDMVGHSGDFDATVKAIEHLDGCIERLTSAIRKAGGEMLITADHGNAELMFDIETQQAHTAHTTNPVPLVYIGRPATLAATGSLEDLAPTMLALMGLSIPSEMSGKPMVHLADPDSDEAQSAA